MKSRKVRRLFFLLLSIVIVFSMNTSAFENTESIPQKIQLIINKEKVHNYNDIGKIKDEFRNYLYTYKNLDSQISENKIIINKNTKKPNIISEKKLIEDVNYLFDILKYGYAGYEYFGGDETFKNAKKSIVQDIKETSIFTLLTNNAFGDILRNNLDFIQDLHFAIGGKSPGKRYYSYMNYNYEFKKDINGFYTEVDNKKVYLIFENNDEYEDYLKPSINDEGEIIYRVGKLHNYKGKSIQIDIKLKNIKDDKILNEKVDLLITRGKHFQRKVPYNVYKKDGISIIEHRDASANYKNRKKLEQFAKEGEDFKNEKYLIIDLRDNSGGSDIYANDWIGNFTGVKPGGGKVGSTLMTDTANKLLLNSIYKKYGMKADELEKEYEVLFDVTESGWSKIELDEQKIINNKTIIFVLIDKGVASAGESFVEFLNQLENTIFIGTNTAGLINFSNMGMCNLPNSKVEVLISKSISIDPDLILDEGKGYYPDFWVDPENSLDITFKFINNYFRSNK